MVGVATGVGYAYKRHTGGDIADIATRWEFWAGSVPIAVGGVVLGLKPGEIESVQTDLQSETPGETFSRQHDELYVAEGVADTIIELFE